MSNSIDSVKTSVLINSDDFGCCSRYRACSDSGKCLISHLDYSNNCTYRRQLESGHIFYGKHADGFSSDRYASIQAAVSALSPDASSVLNGILSNLCDYNRGRTRCIVRSYALDELTSLGLFHILALGAEFPSLCSARKLSQMVKDNPDFLARFTSAGNARDTARLQDKKLPSKNSKDFLIEWLNGDASDIRDTLADPYRIIEIIPESACYVEELYQDLCSPAQNTYSLSPLAEDGLLMDSEIEKERVRYTKLSKSKVSK